MKCIVTDEMINAYLKSEGYTERQYVQGYMEDGYSEDDVYQMLVDNAYDYWRENQ